MTDPIPLYCVPLGIQGVVTVGAVNTSPNTLLGSDLKCTIGIENLIEEFQDGDYMSGEIRAQKLTLMTTVVKDTFDEGVQFVIAAFQAGSKIAISAIDRPSEGLLKSYGVVADWLPKKLTETQDDQGVDMLELEFQLYTGFRPPAWINGT